MGIDANTIHEELTAALGLNASSYPTMVRWASRFREGREDANDDPRSSYPASERTDENIELIRQIINNNPHSTDDEIITESSFFHGTIKRNIHDCLKMKKKTFR